MHVVHVDVPVDSALYAPAVQAGQEDAPGAVPKVPAAHAAQADVPEVTDANLPTAHAVHTAEVAAPATLPYVPTAHAVQPVVPPARAL